MKRITILLFCFCLLLLWFSCKTEQTKPKPLFSLLKAEDSGIAFANILTENDSLNYFTYGYIYMGGGISAGDINNDGLTDLYFTGNMVPNKLYLNKGNMKFQDISESAGVAGDNRWYTGVTMADVNHDGFLDIYCSVGGKFGTKENQLFLNNGDQTFTEKASDYGLAETGNSVQSTFFDYDLDGDLDVYVANYPPTSFDAPNQYYSFKKFSPKDIETDKLFRNDGGTFTDVTDEAGVRSFGLSLSATVGDMNQDGWPDFYVSNDFSTPDLFYINNKDGTFSEQLKTTTKNTAFYGMGVDIADFNNDGLLDIFQVDMTPIDNRRSKANMASMNTSLFWSTVNAGFHYQYMQNSLQMNNGNLNDTLPDFSNISRLAGISSTDWSWAPLFADLDNDGLKDIFVSNGTRREINNNDYFRGLEGKKRPKDSLLEKSLNIPSEKIDNFVFRNKGDLTFEKMNESWGLSFKGFSNGAIYVDLDNDGDLDLVTNNIDDQATLFQNSANTVNNALTLKFKGQEHNPSGLGVKVTLSKNGKHQFQEMTLSRGFQSSIAPLLHFGVGTDSIIDSVLIQWPDKKIQTLTNIKANQLVTVNHKDAKDKIAITNQQTKLFATVTDTTSVPYFRHLENYFDDFQKEILLPHQTSMFGPALATGDLNGDGLEDLILGGSYTNETAVFYQTSNGFAKQQLPALIKDKTYEDVGALIFDADKDGDQDIYMVSGGNEFEQNPNMLQDRLYVNNGNGVFEKSSNALPKMLTSGSRVQPIDFDKDGDLDLFVAGRLVPGNYPSPADSYLLENKSTTEKIEFKDVTADLAPELKNLGMVTDAIWTDYNQDGYVDLIAVGEWMPISVFKNSEGKLVEATKELGLQDSNGWWFSIAQADFDKDGDMDYVVGNLGLNYKYKASADGTFDIYYNDFDNNQTNDIVLSYFNGGKKYPLRGRECSSQQMPGIKKKFEDYASFSTATLEDVFTEQYLENSLHYQIKSFASVYIENSNGKFITTPLPKLAQISSIHQILVDDYNGDSHLDILIAGNLHASEVETPRNDAGNGLLLQGNGKGSFVSVPGKESGLFASGDIKDMRKLSINGFPHIVFGKNNDYLQFVKINRNKQAKNSAAAVLLP